MIKQVQTGVNGVSESVRAQFKSFDRLVCKLSAQNPSQGNYVFKVGIVGTQKVAEAKDLLYSVYTSECKTCDNGVSEIKACNV